MEHFGILSLLPPVLAIFLAIRTKQVFIALFFGIWLGWVILNGGNVLLGTTASIQALVDVFKDDGNTRTIMFSALVGALIAYIQRSGGVKGFVIKVEQWLTRLEQKNQSDNRKIIQWLAGLSGMIIFVESSISVLTVGSLYRPVFDRLGISREKLAYIADSSSAPACILIPFNAWGAYIMGLLILQGLENPIKILAYSFPYNFYPLLTIAMVAYIIASGKDFGPMKKAEIRAKAGKLMDDNAQPMVSSEITMMLAKEGITPNAIHMLFPIATMVCMMPLMLIITGWSSTDAQLSMAVQIIEAIGNGSGSTSVLYSVIISLVASAVLFRFKGIMKTSELVEVAFKGIGGLMPIALLMLFAFAIGNVCQELGTGIFVAEATRSWLSPALIPMLIFIVSAFIAFATGTSWGTFAIMMAIAVPMSQTLGANMYMVIAAVMGGGVFGDHCSPISDTTILSSMAAACDHIDHVKTQLPYALAVGVVSAMFYLVAGVLSTYMYSA
jgi:Na+/H+ antiporter NhaC